MFTLPRNKAVTRPFMAVMTVTALCLALAGAQSAVAAESATPTQRQLAQDKLKDTLKLTPAQSALLKKAEDGSQAARKAQMDEQIKRMQEHRKAMDTAVDKNVAPDLRKLAQEQDKQMDARMALHKQVRDGWLNFYDALDAKQKVDAVKFLQARIAMHDGMAGMHGMKNMSSKQNRRMGRADGQMGGKMGGGMGDPKMDAMPEHGAMPR